MKFYGELKQILMALDRMNLSDFMQYDIRRIDDIAEIIVAYDNDDESKPIRLIGFATESSKCDFEIYEEGLDYYNKLVDQVEDLDWE